MTNYTASLMEYYRQGLSPDVIEELLKNPPRQTADILAEELEARIKEWRKA